VPQQVHFIIRRHPFAEFALSVAYISPLLPNDPLFPRLDSFILCLLVLLLSIQLVLALLVVLSVLLVSVSR
jgi:hypothetical protein